MIKQNLKDKILNRWKCRWKMLPCYFKTRVIDKTTPSKNWLKPVANLSHAQASLCFQLCTSHIDLNKHLFWIKCIVSPIFNNCNDALVESIQYFLLNVADTAKKDTLYREVSAVMLWTSLTHYLTQMQLYNCSNTFTQQDIWSKPLGRSMSIQSLHVLTTLWNKTPD